MRRRGPARSGQVGPDGPPSFLLVTQYFPPERGAAQVRLGAIVTELARRGHRVEVLTAIPNYPAGRLYEGWSRRPVQVADEDGVRTVRVWVWAAVGSGLGRLANYLSFAAMSLVGLSATSPADWTIVEYPTLPGALPAVMWCRLRRRRLVVNVADLWVDVAVEVGVVPEGRAAEVARRLERWMLQRADVVNAVTEGVAEALTAKGVAPERLRWLPNGVDASLFTPGPADPSARVELGVPDGHDVVLYAGTHGYVHGLDVVLDAAAELADLPITVVLVGGGSEKQRLRRRAGGLSLSNVRFIDPVAPERVADYLRVATIGLATVRSGELYRSVRSAKMLPVMASAVPLVYAADDEGAAIVAREGAGLVTPPGDATALAGALRSLLHDPEQRARMGQHGRDYVLAHASWAGLLDDWLDSLGADGRSTRR